MSTKSHSNTGEKGAKILILGSGVLGGAVLDFLSQSGGNYQLVVGGRDTEHLSRRVNLARYTALNLGQSPEIEFVEIDLHNVEQTAEKISEIKPDVIFNATTLHSWWVITQLPSSAFQKLDTARGGAWTAMHVVLARKLMQAVRLAGVTTPVVNASYPDVVNAALAGEGLSPTIGIGNIANAVPGVRLAVADIIGCHVDEIDVRFFTHHYLSYRMPSTGGTDGAPYHLTILRNGKELKSDSLDDEMIFSLVAGKFRRVKGLAGQSVTASSATAVLRAIADDTGRVVHAPGPLGLVGGYPVKLNRSSISVELPSHLTLEGAIEINSKCQQFDGIKDVDASGTVHFMPETVSVMREELGYDHENMPLHECEEQAEELAQKFAEYQQQVAPDLKKAA